MELPRPPPQTTGQPTQDPRAIHALKLNKIVTVGQICIFLYAISTHLFIDSKNFSDRNAIMLHLCKHLNVCECALEFVIK